MRMEIVASSSLRCRTQPRRAGATSSTSRAKKPRFARHSPSKSPTEQSYARVNGTRRVTRDMTCSGRPAHQHTSVGVGLFASKVAMNERSRERDVRNEQWWRSLYFAPPFYDESHIFSNGGTWERGRVANEQLVTPVETLTLDERGASNDREIWTVGHSTRSIEEFLALLDDYAINLLVDVRSYPGSRRCPQFGRETMRTGLRHDRRNHSTSS